MEKYTKFPEPSQKIAFLVEIDVIALVTEPHKHGALSLLIFKFASEKEKKFSPVIGSRGKANFEILWRKIAAK